MSDSDKKIPKRWRKAVERARVSGASKPTSRKVSPAIRIVSPSNTSTWVPIDRCGIRDRGEEGEKEADTRLIMTVVPATTCTSLAPLPGRGPTPVLKSFSRKIFRAKIFPAPPKIEGPVADADQERALRDQFCPRPGGVAPPRPMWATAFVTATHTMGAGFCGANCGAAQGWRWKLESDQCNRAETLSATVPVGRHALTFGIDRERLRAGRSLQMRWRIRHNDHEAGLRRQTRRATHRLVAHRFQNLAGLHCGRLVFVLIAKRLKPMQSFRAPALAQNSCFEASILPLPAGVGRAVAPIPVWLLPHTFPMAARRDQVIDCACCHGAPSLPTLRTRSSPGSRSPAGVTSTTGKSGLAACRGPSMI
jgi:hypothetical protein